MIATGRPKVLFVSYIYLGYGKRDSDGSDLFGGIRIFWKMDHLIGHLIDGPDDLEHLVSGDLPVAVNVVELEGPWKNTDEQVYTSTMWTGAQSGGARETLAHHRSPRQSSAPPLLFCLRRGIAGGTQQ